MMSACINVQQKRKKELGSFLKKRGTLSGTWIYTAQECCCFTKTNNFYSYEVL